MLILTIRLLECVDFIELCSGPNELALLQSAYSRFNDLNDPLRCCLFALIIRELIRIVMNRLAPDDEVKKTSWFVGYKLNSSIKVSRGERYRFALSGHIGDNAFRKFQQLDISSEVAALKSIQDDLSKYTHISGGSFSPSPDRARTLIDSIEEAGIIYGEKYISYHDAVIKAAVSIIEDEVQEKAKSDIYDTTMAQGHELMDIDFSDSQIERLDLTTPKCDVIYSVTANFTTAKLDSETHRVYTSAMIISALVDIDVSEMTINGMITNGEMG